MTPTDEMLKKRFIELAGRAAAQGVYTFTQFLDLNAQGILLSQKKALSGVPVTLFGGLERCERAMARFGSPELCGYEQDFPIACVRIAPRSEKYADALTHRDFLGALISLGIKRETLGDIFISKSAAYLFCTDTVALYIIENLISVRHTDVDCEAIEPPREELTVELTPMTVKLTSERLDAVIARAYGLSREQSAELFRRGRVFVNSAPETSISAGPRPGDIVSVRGMGRFVYRGVTGETKKGKLNVLIEKY